MASQLFLADRQTDRRDEGQGPFSKFCECAKEQFPWINLTSRATEGDERDIAAGSGMCRYCGQDAPSAWGRVHLAKRITYRLVKKFASFCEVQKVHCHVYQNHPLVPIMSRMNSIHDLQSHYFKLHFNIILPPLSIDCRPLGLAYRKVFILSLFVCVPLALILISSLFI